MDSMVIDMNEAQVRTVEQVRQVLEGTQALQFQAARDDEGRYAWIDAVLRRLDQRLALDAEAVGLEQGQHQHDGHHRHQTEQDLLDHGRLHVD